MAQNCNARWKKRVTCALLTTRGKLDSQFQMLPTPVEKFVFAILFSRTSHGTSLSFLEKKNWYYEYVHISTRKRDLLGWVYTARSGQANSGHLHPRKTENLLAMFCTMLNGTGGRVGRFLENFWSSVHSWRLKKMSSDAIGGWQQQ